MAELLEDFPAGPLDLYRRKASFDWKQMKLFLFGEEEIRHSHHIWQVLRRYPEFQPIQTPLDFDAERHLAFKQAAIIRHHQAEMYAIQYDTKFNAFSDYAPAALVKMGLGIKIFTGILEKLGSERHRGIIQEIRQGKVSGCFAMTEIGHGTNVKGMKTSATYLSESEEFELHTPDFLAAKCWAGNLGNVATHAIVYAQLYVSGVHHGLHVFVVPIRDPETLQPFPGVTVGDMGEKIGLNGIDNGFLLFSHYRIPRAYLLNDTGDVTEEGRYVTPYQNESQRFGASLLALSASRVWVTAQSDAYGGCALTTALRYSAVRRQFAPSEGEQEVAILEYQTQQLKADFALHQPQCATDKSDQNQPSYEQISRKLVSPQQYRLLPHLAAAYMLKVFTRYLNDVFEQMIGQPRSASISLLAVEVHVVTCAAKPLSGWLMRDAIQSCREACGGHGYLKGAGLGAWRANQDAALTYEGENWVLVQQTSNFLLKIWPQIRAGTIIESPLGSVDFLNEWQEILRARFEATTVQELCRPAGILRMFQWRACYLLQQTAQALEGRLEGGQTKFWARSDSQVFAAKDLAVAFSEHFLLRKFLDKVASCSDGGLRPVLLRVFALYGLFSLEKSLGLLYQGGFAQGAAPGQLIQRGVLELCAQLKDEAVALVDVIAPPDAVLNSTLGASDGRVYGRLEQALFGSPYGAGRPTWWADIVGWKQFGLQAKL
ncbi:hypothetical protein D910_03038 [Dendroctonus ponderosae]|uniref:Acyl-coenzyme A oxidase n=1 Tax=Dendroctonus ponderosae TaxID=77166 RepID=U4TVK8_DENPD|nr:hypothetical protein D910_03038 [Dendroctonus ponderosae]